MTDEERGIYAERRRRAMAAIGGDGVMVLSAAPELIASRDTELRYRPDTDLFYLTGYTEPEAVLVLAPGAAAPFTVFVRPRDPERELWTGVRGGVEAAREIYGADEAHPVGELGSRLPGLLAGRAAIHASIATGRVELDALVRDTVAKGRAARQRPGRGARQLLDPGVVLDEMRLFKDAHELALMREAARITADAFRECAAAIHDGVGEWEVQAALEYGFRRRGGDGPAFESIVASGANATVLHYVANDRRMRAGELLLVDAGVGWRGYAADITRTFPVAGSFTPDQRALYDVVLAAHSAGIAAARPGEPTDGVHRATVRVLVAGLVELGLLRGDPAELATDEQNYKAFYPHKTSHWLGLDVHDVGDYAVDGEPRRLEPGMVLTVEPGLYIPASAEAAPPGLRGTGIRIEDDVVITASGGEVITGALPAGAEDVAALVGS